MRKAANGRGLMVQARRSETDQEGIAAGVRYLKERGRRRGIGHSSAVTRRKGAGTRWLQRAVGGAPPRRGRQAAGLEGRITGHSGRVGLASEFTARGAGTTETMLAGGWRTARMVARYSAAATAEHRRRRQDL